MREKERERANERETPPQSFSLFHVESNRLDDSSYFRGIPAPCTANPTVIYLPYSLVDPFSFSSEHYGSNQMTVMSDTVMPLQRGNCY